MYDATPDDGHAAPPEGPPEPVGTEPAAPREADRLPADGPEFAPEPDAEPEPAPDAPAQDTAGTAPRPLGLVTQPTGHAEVDAQLRRLADADHLAVFGHLDVYEDVHRGLRSTLSALDQHDPGS